MNSLTVTEYLCHRWQRICSVCRSHNRTILYSKFKTRLQDGYH